MYYSLLTRNICALRFLEVGKRNCRVVHNDSKKTLTTGAVRNSYFEKRESWRNFMTGDYARTIMVPQAPCGTGRECLARRRRENFGLPLSTGRDPIVSFSAPVVTGWDGTICVQTGRERDGKCPMISRRDGNGTGNVHMLSRRDGNGTGNVP